MQVLQFSVSAIGCRLVKNVGSIAINAARAKGFVEPLVFCALQGQKIMQSSFNKDFSFLFKALVE